MNSFLKVFLILAIGLLPSAVCPMFAPIFAMDKSDLEYSRPDGKPLLLDMHVPDGRGPFPAVIVVHGGGFDQGTKRSYVPPVLDVLTKAGFAWFSIDYRMAPAYHFPQPVEDVNEAIRWVKKNAAAYHVDPSKIALLGESAGAYLVTYAATHETPATKLAATVDLYGPVDYAKQVELRRDHPERFDMVSANRHTANGGGQRYFGIETIDAAAMTRLHEVSPITAVHKGMAPFLIIHGTADNQVAYEESPAMCDAIRKVGAKCDLISVEGGGHGMSSWEKSPAMQHWKPELADWLNKTLKVENTQAGLR
jgi:acetyl esterase